MSLAGSPDSDTSPTALLVTWSAAYRPEWDATPGAYLAHGAVGWGRSRRLARAEDHARALKAYLGVQHYDPGRWHSAGEPRAVFFLSLFLHGRTVTLRTYPSVVAALADLRSFHASLSAGESRDGGA
jgi:hypothetical protein